VAVLVGLIFRNAQSGVENLRGASEAELKRVFFGDRPYVFYCSKVGKSSDTPPAAFVTLHAELRSKVGFATLDCNQKLPSGKTIKEKFKLKKKAHDKIFVTSPWGVPQQADGPAARDVKLLRKFIVNASAARARPVTSSAELIKQCGFNDTISAADVSPCLVLVKGTRFAERHTELEELIVKGYKSLKVVSMDAAKHRLSIENSDNMPADHFAMKVYALKGMKRSLSMIYPLEWDNVQSFVSNVIRQPLSGFDEHRKKGGITVVKAPAKATFKDRTTQAPPTQEEKPSNVREKGRQRRERDARERMEREAEDLFEEVGEDDDLDEDGEEDEESGGEDNDEDIIEL
jgi:hypothetical protein